VCGISYIAVCLIPTDIYVHNLSYVHGLSYGNDAKIQIIVTMHFVRIKLYSNHSIWHNINNNNNIMFLTHHGSSTGHVIAVWCCESEQKVNIELWYKFWGAFKYWHVQWARAGKCWMTEITFEKSFYVKDWHGRWARSQWVRIQLWICSWQLSWASIAMWPLMWTSLPSCKWSCAALKPCKLCSHALVLDPLSSLSLWSSLWNYFLKLVVL